MSFIDTVTKHLFRKLAVCIPARDQMHTATAFCLWNLSGALKTKGIESRLFVSPGTLIANQRHELVLAARDWGATHVMFIDSDIVFEPEDVIKLLDHEKEIMAACYSKRAEPIINTAWRTIDDWNSWVRISEDDHGIQPVEAIALGFCLIKMSVFDIIDLPWFQLGYYSGQYTGEDIEFSRKAKENNINIFIDVDVSRRLKHLGTFGFTVIGDD